MEPQLPIRALFVLPYLLFLDLAAPQSAWAQEDCPSFNGTLGEILSGNVCCPSSCEECDQQGCQGECCGFEIAESGHACSGTQQAPCVLAGKPDAIVTIQEEQVAVGPALSFTRSDSGFVVQENGYIDVDAQSGNAIYVIFGSAATEFADPPIQIAVFDCQENECSPFGASWPSNFKINNFDGDAFALIDDNSQSGKWCYQILLTPPQSGTAPLKSDPKIYNNHPDCIPSEDEVKTPVPVP